MSYRNSCIANSKPDARLHSTDPYTAPFAPDPDVDQFYREKVRAVVDIVLGAWNGEAPTVVLSGSLALGDGRATRTPEGPGPASDVDLYLVTEEAAHAAALTDLPRIHGALRRSDRTSDLTVDLGVTTAARLAAAPVSIANRTLAEHGRVLTGDREVLDAMRSVRGRPIPPADGLLLLQNRTVEALVPVALFGDSSMHDAFWYLHAKTLRDIGLSAIVAAGRFAPRPGDRAELVRATWEESELGKVVPGFPARYEESSGSSSRGSAPSRGSGSSVRGETALRRAWEDLGTTLFAVARWEHRTIDPHASDDPNSWVRAGSGPLRRRVKSWLPFATGDPGAFAKALTRGFPGTPMQGAYVAASCLMASAGTAWGGGAPDQGTMIAGARAICPFTVKDRRPDAAWWELRNAICEYWNETVLGGSRTIEKGGPR